MKLWPRNNMDIFHSVFIRLRFLLVKSMGIHRNRYVSMRAVHTNYKEAVTYEYELYYSAILLSSPAVRM
jgi:hypothetical protein